MNHVLAKRLLIAGMVVIPLAMVANVLLGGSLGLLWLGLVAAGAICVAVGLIYFIMNPIRRNHA